MKLFFEISPDERKIRETVEAAKAAYYQAEREKQLSYWDFLWQQGRYIHKRWWLLQALVLLLAGWALRESGTEYAVRRCLGTGAPLFGVLILPELWKNRRCDAMEVESSTLFSLRQVYAARFTLFAGADVVLLSVFLANAGLTLRLTMLELAVNFLLPFCVTCCICVRCLYTPRIRSETVPVLFCALWTALWLVILLNEPIYSRIAVPAWMVLLALSLLYLGGCILRGQKKLNSQWEVLPIWS